MLYAILLIVIIVVVSVVAAFAVMQGGKSPNALPGGQTSSPGLSPSGQGGNSPTPTVSFSGNPGSSIADAQSLKFSVTYTAASGNAQEGFSYTWSSKNIGTNNMMIKIEGTIGGADVAYIINGAQQKAWVKAGPTWTQIPEFASEWDSWDQTWQSFKSSMVDWTSGEWTYSVGGDTVRMYNIQVNPNLADSLFQP